MGDLFGGILNLITGGVLANQGKQSQMGAVGRQQAMAQGLWATPLAPYGKKAKQGIWDLINPELQAVLSGQTQVINPELSSGMYNMLTRDLTKNYQDTRKGLEQGLVNRGMDYGNVMQKSLGKADESYRTQLGDIGTKVAFNAATTNYQAQQDRYRNLLSVLGNLFGQAKQQQYGMKQQGLSGLFDANSAQAAAQGHYWNAIAGLLGNTMGQASGMFGGQTGGLTPDALTAILPLFTNRPTTR
jgi:hypothetical protein